MRVAELMRHTLLTAFVSLTAGCSDAGGGGARFSSGGSNGAGGDGGAGADSGTMLPPFSFFVTSLSAMRRLSGSQDGFGGDLRFGKATGLEGADEICRQIADSAMPGAGQKTWRAFLSAVSAGPGGTPVHAKDRIGEGPWYDYFGRLVAATKEDLLQERPRGAHSAIIDDLPNEYGVPNHTDGATGACTAALDTPCPDNHDVLTGTGPDGMLYADNPEFTCHDWTSKEPIGSPWCGHSWPRQGSGINWMSALAEGGCAPGVNLEETGNPMPGVRTVGTGGGYGGIYCFALMP